MPVMLVFAAALLAILIIPLSSIVGIMTDIKSSQSKEVSAKQ